MAITTTFLKDPDSTLDYTLDWTAWLDGDTITSSTWTVPAGLVQESATYTTTTATIWLSGGIAGNDYVITNSIVTAAGRIEDRSIRIRVIQR
jgi:hypothetical protein